MDRGGDPFFDVDYSLLAPRPFRPQQQQQYQSVSSAGNNTPVISNGSSGGFLLNPQEPPQWGYFDGGGDQQYRSPAAADSGSTIRRSGERIIPINIQVPQGSTLSASASAADHHRRDRSAISGDQEINRSITTDHQRHHHNRLEDRLRDFMDDHRFYDEDYNHRSASPYQQMVVKNNHGSGSGSGNGNGRKGRGGIGGGGGVERVIPVRMEGGSGGAVSGARPQSQRQQQHYQHPQSGLGKSVRFSDLVLENNEPISPVYAAERRAPLREGSVVRQIPTTAEDNTSLRTRKSQIYWEPTTGIQQQQQQQTSSGNNNNWNSMNFHHPQYQNDHFGTPAAAGGGMAWKYGAGSGTAGEEMAEAPPLVKIFDESVIDGPLREFLDLSAKIGGDVATIGALTKEAFQSQRVFLWKAAGMQKPSDTELANLLKLTSDKIEAIQNMKSSNRTSAFFNHLSAIGEGIPALGWVTVSPTPAPFIKEMSDASMFYTNRVLKDYKEKDKTHTDWVKAWLQTLSELQQFVKRNHTTGLVWNTTPGASPQGSAAGAGGGPPPPPPIGGLPPPPPPPPPQVDLGLSGGGGAGADARAALFAEINKGMDITKGLKKVTSDMQTHKNPSLRQQQPVPPAGPGAAGDQAGAARGKPSLPPKPAHLLSSGSNVAAPTTAPKGTTTPQANQPTPVLICEGGKKWMVEHHKGNKNIIIEIAHMGQVVYIYKCTDCVIQIKGKANSITMDSCKKTSVVVDNLLSCMEVINCQSAQVQTLGAMPTLAIQKTDGCQVYLSRDSLNAEIVTSKSSEMNILVPDEQGEYHEFPVPEQYRTLVKGKKLVTEVVDIA